MSDIAAECGNVTCSLKSGLDSHKQTPAPLTQKSGCNHMGAYFLGNMLLSHTKVENNSVKCFLCDPNLPGLIYFFNEIETQISFSVRLFLTWELVKTAEPNFQ